MTAARPDGGGTRGGPARERRPGPVDPHVLARARARVLGAPSVSASDPVPPGTVGAADGTRVWLLPEWPDGATPALLEGYETAPMPLDRAGQARRVLAAALRCCWPRLDDAPWPGIPATVADVLEVYANMSRGDTDLARRWATGELRRLSGTGWLLLDEPAGTLRPGPRVALWPEGSLASLRDLLRRLPQPPRPGPAPAAPSEFPVSSMPPADAERPVTEDPPAAPEPTVEDSELVDNSAVTPSEPGAIASADAEVGRVSTDGGASPETDAETGPETGAESGAESGAEAGGSGEAAASLGRGGE